ncbi:catalase family protein [Roseateles sp. NT4]|uniref:catalase family protein n=1 Tax=Roseateles sp. NT4 TaxID=3453715 RepID=UPI003EEF0918
MNEVLPEASAAPVYLNVDAQPPVAYSPSVERVEPDEADAIADIEQSLQKIADITYRDEGRGLRAVHAKSHALLYGKLHVLDNLPPLLAQGLFAQPGTYPAVLRISTSPGDLLDDKVSTPRGIALKVLGVQGERLAGSEQATTQDFLMVNAPAFNKPNAQKFAGALKLLASTTDKAEGAKKLLSALLRGTEKLLEAMGTESATLKGLGGHPLHHPLGETYFSAVPFRFGDYIAKFSLAPVSPELEALEGVAVDLKDQPDGLRLAVEDFFNRNAAFWELRVQLCRDLDTMPVEDASVEWPQEHSPYLPVAQLTVAAHAPMTSEARHREEDALFFNPWHGLAAHQPLGSVNRARRSAYELSGRARAERNGVAFEEPGVAGAGRCPFR